MSGPARELQRFADQQRAEAHERHITSVILAATPDVVIPTFDNQTKLAKGLRLWLEAGTPKTGPTFTALRDTLTAAEKTPRPKERKR